MRQAPNAVTGLKITVA